MKAHPTPSTEEPLYSESAELYDAIHAEFKDYAAESAMVAGLLRERHPSARTILDVGCGTGEHAKHLRQTYAYHVDGLDLDANLLGVARRKLPDARFDEGDMTHFELGRRFDVVSCLFSAIGYVRTHDRLVAALTCFHRHLAPGGLVVVEPWLQPGVLRVGPGTSQSATIGEVRVERTSFVSVNGTVSRLDFEYHVTDHSGEHIFGEVHELGLFTTDEMLDAFGTAGLEASHDSQGISGRGLFVARAAGEVQ